MGSGGTLPVQALVARPAMNTWQVAQSPLSMWFWDLVKVIRLKYEKNRRMVRRQKKSRFSIERR